MSLPELTVKPTHFKVVPHEQVARNDPGVGAVHQRRKAHQAPRRFELAFDPIPFAEMQTIRSLLVSVLVSARPWVLTIPRSENETGTEEKIRVFLVGDQVTIDWVNAAHARTQFIVEEVIGVRAQQNA